MTTGRYTTVRELEAWVWYFASRLPDAETARLAGVSPVVVHRILSGPPPPPEAIDAQRVFDSALHDGRRGYEPEIRRAA